MHKFACLFISIASVHRNYPSWVEDLTTQNDYPSWVDDIDKTQFTNSGSLNITKQNQRLVSLLPVLCNTRKEFNYIFALVCKLFGKCRFYCC